MAINSIDDVVPKQQSLQFIINQSLNGLNEQYTIDENGHIAKNSDYQRQLPTLWIRQGSNSLYGYTIKTVGADLKPFNLSIKDSMIEFRGINSGGRLISSDEGFDTSKASAGAIEWAPVAEISAVAGNFKTAQFVIESEDRSKKYHTLDFNLCVIANDVALPSTTVQNMWSDELIRLLDQISKIQSAIEDQMTYSSQLTDATFQTFISNLSAQTSDLTSQLAAIKTASDGIDEKVAKAETDVTDAVKKWNERLAGQNLVTKDELTQAVADAVGKLLTDSSTTGSSSDTNKPIGGASGSTVAPPSNTASNSNSASNSNEDGDF